MSGTCFLWVPAAYREPFFAPFEALPLQELRFPQLRPALPGPLRYYWLMRQTFTSSALSSRPKRKSLQVAVSPCRHQALSRRYLRESFSTCLDPYPGGSCGALIRFFPQDIGLPDVSDPVGAIQIPVLQLLYGSILSRLQSFSNVQARRFACCTPVAPTAECVICRPSSVCLRVRWLFHRFRFGPSVRLPLFV